MKKERPANANLRQETEESFSLEAILKEFGAGDSAETESASKPAAQGSEEKSASDSDFLNLLKARAERERAAMEKGKSLGEEKRISGFEDDPAMQYWLNLNEQEEAPPQSAESRLPMQEPTGEPEETAGQEAGVAVAEKEPEDLQLEENAPKPKRNKKRKKKKAASWQEAPEEEMHDGVAESLPPAPKEDSAALLEREEEPEPEPQPESQPEPQKAPVVEADIPILLRFPTEEKKTEPPVDEPTVRFQAVRAEEAPAEAPLPDEELEELTLKYDGFRRHTAPRSRPAKKTPSPEKQYRAAANGLRGSMIRLTFCFLTALIAVGLAVCQTAGWLSAEVSGGSLGYAGLALLLLCALFSYDVLSDGISKLLSGRFTLNFLVLLAVVLCLIDGVMSLLADSGTYCAVACVLLASAQWGFFLNRRVQCNTMDVARKMPEANALVREKDLWNRSDGVLCGKADVEEFMEHAAAPVLPERMLNWYGAFLLVFSGVFAGMYCKSSAGTFVHNFTAILLAGIPALTFVMVWRPWAILSKRLHGCGAAIAGWHGVQLLRGKLAVPVSDQDLFPAEKLKMNGTKFFGNCPPELVLAYGASVMEASGSGLSAMFNRQLAARNGKKYPVSNLKRYETGGVGAEIGMDSVLVGTLRFMQSMGVDMPRSTRVAQAVYVAINAEVCGVFAVNYGVTRSTAAALSALTRSTAVAPVLTARDFILTEAFLRAKFHVDTKHIVFPPFAARGQLDGRTPHEDAPQCALLTKPDFVSTALVITGGRSLYTGALWGAMWAIVSGLFGAGIMAVLASLGASELMDVGRLLLYMAVWAVPTFLWSMWPQIS